MDTPKVYVAWHSEKPAEEPDAVSADGYARVTPEPDIDWEEETELALCYAMASDYAPPGAQGELVRQALAERIRATRADARAAGRKLTPLGYREAYDAGVHAGVEQAHRSWIAPDVLAQRATIERVRALLPYGGMLFAPMSPADPQWVAGVDAANAWWDAAIKKALGDE